MIYISFSTSTRSPVGDFTSCIRPAFVAVVERRRRRGRIGGSSPEEKTVIVRGRDHPATSFSGVRPDDSIHSPSVPAQNIQQTPIKTMPNINLRIYDTQRKEARGKKRNKIRKKKKKRQKQHRETKKAVSSVLIAAARALHLTQSS